EHLELIEKWKTRDLEESAKKKTEDIGESSRSGVVKKSKGKSSSSSRDGEHNLKAWMASNFGVSLKRIAEKFGVIDNKTKDVDAQREKPVKKIAEFECRAKKGEGSSSEKRKRVMGANSPAAELQKRKSRSRSGGAKTRQPRIPMSSDDEEEDKKAQNAMIQGETIVPRGAAGDDGGVKLDDIMALLAYREEQRNPEREIQGAFREV
ncbi:hypothetical protein CBR_g81163, partial [Chara braunii]